jgi:peptidyl-prolyl cis-trans isomerase SurA
MASTRSWVRIFGLLTVLQVCPAADAREVDIDRIVAIVDEDVIMQSELDRQMQRVRSQMRQQGAQLPPSSVFEKQVLERLILQKIQLQRAQSSGIQIDEESLNRTIGGIAAENGLSLRQFRDILESEGYPFSQFREDIRDEIVISRLVQREVENRITVTDREIDNQLSTLEQQGSLEKEYWLQHILIAVPSLSTEAEREQIRHKGEGVVEELRQGKDFSETAVEISEGQQALEGGDLGWRKSSQLPTLFANIVMGMEEGQISDLIDSPSGFHIVRLAGVRSGEKHMVEQTHAQHILVRPNELTSEDDARTRLEQLKLRIEGGESFENMARSHSDDRASAVDGGDLGWVSPGDLVPEFEEVMNSLAPGEVSDPFKTQFGLHIVRVIDRRDYDGTEEVRRAKAREIIRKRKIEEQHEAWLRRMRDEAYVEYRLLE